MVLVVHLCLRRVPEQWVHVIAFGLAGAAVGVAVRRELFDGSRDFGELAAAAALLAVAAARACVIRLARRTGVVRPTTYAAVAYVLTVAVARDAPGSSRRRLRRLLWAIGVDAADERGDARVGYYLAYGFLALVPGANSAVGRAGAPGSRSRPG